MKSEIFDELLACVQEMDEIVRGKKAARVTDFPEPEVKAKAIREKVGLSQNRFAIHHKPGPSDPCEYLP